MKKRECEVVDEDEMLLLGLKEREDDMPTMEALEVLKDR